MNRREFLKNSGIALAALGLPIAENKLEKQPKAGDKFFLSSKSPHLCCKACSAKIVFNQTVVTYNGKADNYDTFILDAPFVCRECGRILTEYYDDDCTFQYVNC